MNRLRNWPICSLCILVASLSALEAQTDPCNNSDYLGLNEREQQGMILSERDLKLLVDLKDSCKLFQKSIVELGYGSLSADSLALFIKGYLRGEELGHESPSGFFPSFLAGASLTVGVVLKKRSLFLENKVLIPLSIVSIPLAISSISTSTLRAPFLDGQEPGEHPIYVDGFETAYLRIAKRKRRFSTIGGSLVGGVLGLVSLYGILVLLIFPHL